MKTIVITGSTKGIGYGLAREFASRGFNVAVCGRSQTSVDEAIANIKREVSASGEIVGCAVDVTRASDLQTLWDTANAINGRVDIWINNAGLARTVWSIVDTPESEIEAMVHTNMLGTINGSRIAAKGMLKQGDGKLFNMLGGGSDGEYFPGMGIYGATKRGLDYFTRALVKELKDTQVIVGKIRPGMIITEAVVREAKADFDNFQKSRKTMNNLVDRVETVSPYLADQILATDKSGTKIRWLTGGKIAKRMMLSRIRPRPDQFADFGL